MSIADYFEWYILYIPKWVYVWAIVGFLMVLAVALSLKGRKEGLRLSAAFLLAEYVSLLLYFTVSIWRSGTVYEYRLIPFWSYWAAVQGVKGLAGEIIMNIVVFMPIGFLAGFAMKKALWLKVLVVGFVVSLTIELLQLMLKRGCFETDDLINNTLGCMMGYGVYLCARKVV